MGTFICGIHPEGSAAINGRLQVGDELLKVSLFSRKERYIILLSINPLSRHWCWVLALKIKNHYYQLMWFFIGSQQCCKRSVSFECLCVNEEDSAKYPAKNCCFARKIMPRKIGY